MIDGHGDDLHRYAGIRMNFSSNIYAHADLSALTAHLGGCLSAIGSYPEPEARSLERLVSRQYGVGDDEVLVTAGATDAIYLIAQAFRGEGTFRVLRPTFSEYEDACRIFGYRETDDAALCWLCNPNNPTGEVRTAADVEALAARHRWLVVDRSYADYTLAPQPTAAAMLKAGNIVQVFSLTKRYAVPGLRLGFVVAPRTVACRLRGQYRPWAVHSLAIEAGRWLLTQRPSAVPDLAAYLGEARRLACRLCAIPGVKVGFSQTHFMLCTIASATASALKAHLAASEGILIRDASNIRGLTEHHFRVAAQLPAENDALADAVARFVKQVDRKMT